MKKFSSEWWDIFLQQTENMTQTTTFKNCISQNETKLMRSCVLEIISEIAKLRTNKYGYRIYVDGVLLENNEMMAIYDSPPIKNESVEDWTKRTFGNKKFGMIINQGERFNLHLSKLIANKIEPLLAKKGIPSEGIIFTLFVGNYDSTPLGIHLDLPGKSVIHFHLGPGNKTMYTWDKKAYEKLVGEKIYNNQNISDYLPYANKYPFDEGDLYFMPEDIYHVGTQEGLSIAIACWYNNRSKTDFAKQLQLFIQENYLVKNIENLKADKNSVEDISIIEESLALINLPEELENLTYKDLIRQEYKDFRYSMFSNGGFRTAPFPRNVNEMTININNSIQLESPFKILYKESINREKLHLFIRGIKVETENFECIKNLVDVINKGKPNKASELLKVLDDDWDDEIGLFLLHLLYKHHGIMILPN